MEGFRSGFVAIVGPPNVGKSTLTNTLLSAKVAITSPKPQTTRRRILGVKTLPSTQIIFVDTPGIGGRRASRLDAEMGRHARESARDADLVLFMVDARVPPAAEDKALLHRLLPPERSTPVLLLLNKVDLVRDKRRLLPHIAAYQAIRPFQETFPISARRGDNLAELLLAIRRHLPESPPLFGPEDLTEQTSEFRAAELIREKVLLLVHQEIPHVVAVAVEEMRPGKTEGTRYIRAVIYVEKESQKGILVGKGGRMLKRIGEGARRELEGWLGEQVFLDLWVKLKKEWRNREEILRMLGYTSE